MVAYTRFLDIAAQSILIPKEVYWELDQQQMKKWSKTTLPKTK